MSYLVKTPQIIQRIFKGYLWRFDTSKKEIYLTFDDGPTPQVTNFVLDTLQQFNAKATFFCIGKNVEANPQLFSRIIVEGHSIGNHTFEHLNGFKIPSEAYIESVLHTEKVIKKHSKLKTQNSKLLFRPPYGRITSKQARKLRALGYTIVMWNVLSGDFDVSLSEEKCLENVLKNTANGSIVVLHDSLKCETKLRFVLPKILEYFSEQGFEFKAI